MYMLVVYSNGATIRIRGGGLEYFGNIGKMAHLNNWPQGMVELNILSIEEVEINII